MGYGKILSEKELDLLLSFNFLGVEPLRWRGNDSRFFASFETASGKEIEMFGGWLSLPSMLAGVASTGLGTSPVQFVKDAAAALGLSENEMESYRSFGFNLNDPDTGRTYYGMDGEDHDPEIVPFTRAIFATANDYLRSTMDAHDKIALVAVSTSNRARLYERMYAEAPSLGYVKGTPTEVLGATVTLFDRAARSEELTAAREVDPAMMGKLITKRAIKAYGTTEWPAEAFFILPDGTYLDGSEKRDGGMPGQRTQDHHTAESLLPGFRPNKYSSRHAALMAFCAQTGCVRCDFRVGAFSVVHKPNRYQVRAMAEGLLEMETDEAYIDIVDPSGSVKHSVEMRNPTREKLDSFFADPKGYADW